MYGFDMEAIVHTKAIYYPYMGHSLCHTISILGPYLAHITTFGKGGASHRVNLMHLFPLDRNAQEKLLWLCLGKNTEKMSPKAQ